MTEVLIDILHADRTKKAVMGIPVGETRM